MLERRHHSFPRKTVDLALLSLFFAHRYAPKTQAISLSSFTVPAVKKFIARFLLSINAKRNKEASAKLQDSRASSRKAGTSVLLFSKTAETVTSANYHRILYLTGIVSGTELSHCPCLYSLRIESGRKNVQPVSTLCQVCFFAP